MYYFEKNDGREGEGVTTFDAMKAAVGPEEAHTLAGGMQSLQWRSCPGDDEFAREADAIGADGVSFGWFGDLRR